MKIFLKSLTLTNFKGIRSLSINCDQVTNIYGRNATGKTTLMDAFLWLFFGKDSSDRHDFEIKTLDENNRPYRRLDHEVSCIIEVDGDEINIRKQYREKWTKKRGSAETEFTGHEKNHFWNDVPCNQKEYEAKIASLVNESIFKLLTNTNFFNSLKWDQRRNALLQIAGDISDVDVLNAIEAGNDISFKPLLKALTAKKSIDEYKREIGAKKKLVKEQLESLPGRINENNRNLPEAKDYDAIESWIKDSTTALERVDKMLQDKNEAQKHHQQIIGDKIKEAGELRMKCGEIEFNERNVVADKKKLREQAIINQKRELTAKQDELFRTQTDHANQSKRKATMEADAEVLRNQWYAVNDEKLVFDENEFCCPACKRAFETSDIEAKKKEFTENFNSDKSKRLTDITERGAKLKNDIEIADATINNLKASKIALANEMQSLEEGIHQLQQDHVRLCATEEHQVTDAIADNLEHRAMLNKIKVLNEEINAPYADNKSDLLQQKKELTDKINSLKVELGTKDHREKILARITELQTQESTLAQELASLEGIEFSILQFEKAKMNELERMVNDRFKIVRFKLFEEQINGGEIPCCITLINGVPYPDANTASKIAAGLDIINTLSEHYNVSAPIFIDNRESVLEIPESNSQIINLIVSASHSKLTVGAGEKQLAMA